MAQRGNVSRHVASRGTSSTPFGLEASGIPVAVVQDHGAVVNTGFPSKRRVSLHRYGFIVSKRSPR